MSNTQYSLRDELIKAEEEGRAIGHFNFANIEMLNAICSIAVVENFPVIVGTSEGERDFFGIVQAVAVVGALREKHNHPIFLNADHTYSVEKVKEAIDAGYDAAIFDGAKLSLEENIEKTKECVMYAKASGKDVLIEGELGYIGTSSKLLDEIPEGAGIEEKDLTTPEDAMRFVEEAGVDLFAPAVGNLHGMLKHAANPNLSIERVKKIKEATGIPLVLHGGSGVSDPDFVKAIQSGINVVHISTEIRRAYRSALVESLKGNPEELAPYRIMKGVKKSMEEVILNRMKLFSNRK